MKKIHHILTLSLVLLLSIAATFLETNVTYAVDSMSNIVMSEEDFTSNDIVIDVDPNLTATGTNHGRTFYFLGNQVSTNGTDALGFRLKNLTDTLIPIQTVYLSMLDTQNPDNIYSLMHSTIKFLWVDGRMETTIGNANGRDIKIPADFDGIMIIDWDQLVTVRHPQFNNGTVAYHLRDADRLLKNGTGYHAFPNQTISAIHLFFSPASTVSALQATNELIIGNPMTFNYSDNSHIIYDQTTLSLTPSGNVLVGADTPWTSNVGHYKVINYPETVSTYHLEVNGVSGTFDETINLHTNNSLVTVKFGYKFNLNPEVMDGYILGSIELDGVAIMDQNIRNKNVVSKEYTVNYRTAPFYTHKIGQSESISLSAAKGIMVDVNNFFDESIDFSLVIKDLLGETYTASNKGVGIFITEYASYYGNVFSIPAYFNGKIFIPFNVSSTGVWVGLNNKPFDKSKPSVMHQQISVNYNLTEQVNHESLKEVFSNWTISNETPLLSKTPIGEITTDYDHGFAFYLNESLANNTWTGIPRLYSVPEKTIFLDGLGLGFRFKNTGSSTIQLRLNILGSNGATYSYSYPLSYTRIDHVTQKVEVLSGLAVIIPVGFDGTIIYNLNQLGAGNLSVIGQDASSVAFQNVSIAGLSFYLNATSGDLLYVNPTVMIIDYEGNQVNYENALTVQGSTNFSNARMSQPLSITTNDVIVLVDGVNGETSKVNVNLSRLSLGDTLRVTSEEGYVITSATLDGKSLYRNIDGSYEMYIDQSYTNDLVLKIDTVQKWLISYDYLGNQIIGIYQENEEKMPTMIEPNGMLTFSIQVKDGFSIVSVSSNNQILIAENGMYHVSVTEDTIIKVESEPIVYDIVYHLDGGVNHEYQSKHYRSNQGLILLSPSKEGYQFNGWYTIDVNGEKHDLIRVLPGSTGVLEVYASWSLVESTNDGVFEIIMIVSGSLIAVLSLVVVTMIIIKKKYKSAK